MSRTEKRGYRTPITDEPPYTRIRLDKVDTLSDGTAIGKRGSQWYILDCVGRAISEGYQEITSKRTACTYEGKKGTRTEEFTVRDAAKREFNIDIISR